MAPPKKNAYTFFVEERCRETGKSVPEGFGLFGAEWERLDASGKRKYFQMVDRQKSEQFSFNAPVGNRSAGHPPSQRNQAESANAASSSPYATEPRKMSDIIMEVSHGVAEVVVSADSPGNVDIPTPKFEDLEEAIVETVASEYSSINEILLNDVLVVSCIPLVSLDKNLKEVNRPIEIAIEGFKLGIGYTGSVYHEFVSPGATHSGWYFWVNDARKKYHKIPVMANMKSDEESRTFHKSHTLNEDYYKIYANLVRLTRKSSQGGSYPLLAPASEICVTTACFQWLHMKACQEGHRTGKPVLPEIRFSTLEEYCVNILLQKGLATMEELRTLKNTLGSRRYHHIPALRCKFHKDVDSELCATGTAKDKIFLTFDYLRGILLLPAEGLYIPDLSG